MVLCDYISVSSVICQCSLQPVNACCERFMRDLYVDYHVNCDNFSKVLYLYVSLYMVTKVISDAIVLVVIMSVRCCNSIYCILRGRIKGFNRSITTILFEVGSYRTVVG